MPQHVIGYRAAVHLRPPRTLRGRALAAAGIAVIAALLWRMSVRPSNSRDWSPDQAAAPTVTFSGSVAAIRNVRNSVYRSTTDYDVRLEDRAYDLRDVRTMWYVVEPFSEWEGSAHTFLTFGFTGDRYLGVSIEIRKEKGETFSAVKGLFRKYELMYVIGDERDLIKLRSNFRKDRVYLYPMDVTPEQASAVLRSMLERADALARNPEFYNTLTNNCTTNIADHLNAVIPGAVPRWDRGIVAPGYSDALFLREGLLKTDVAEGELRDAFRINELAERHADDPAFSVRIREGAAKTGTGSRQG